MIERVWPIADKRRALATRYALAGLNEAQENEAIGRAALARLTENGAQTVEVRDHSAPVVEAAFAPNGRMLVSVDRSGRAVVSDAATGDLILALPHESYIQTASFSPDGAQLVTVYSDGTVGIWDTTRHSPVRNFRGHEDRISAASFSPDGQRLLTASFDKTVRLWDVRTGTSIAVLKRHDDVVNSAIFSPDGTRVLTASADNTARLWDAVTGAEIAVLKGHEGNVNSAAFSPDATQMVTASSDNTARIWDTTTGAPLITIRHSAEIETLSFSSDGLHLLANDVAGNFLEWRSADGRLERAVDGAGLGVSQGVFRGDGVLFVGEGVRGPAIVWEAATARTIGVLPHEGTGGRVLGIGPDGQKATIGLDDGRLIIWNLSLMMTPLESLIKEGCARLAHEGANGRKFSEFEIAADPLINEAWSHGDHERDVCKHQVAAFGIEDFVGRLIAAH
jgi:WD40 repeat protein